MYMYSVRAGLYAVPIEKFKPAEKKSIISLGRFRKLSHKDDRSKVHWRRGLSINNS